MGNKYLRAVDDGTMTNGTIIKDTTNIECISTIKVGAYTI